ncbi:hypothetical protein A2U01_0081120, partial [Trifolium medium]|nr:hypothetical protein [Trifolium medium]
MMSINCSSWLFSHFPATIDGIDGRIDGHQRSWPNARGYIYFTHTVEL